MMSHLVDALGVFLYPQLAVSSLVVGLCVAYLVAAARGELQKMDDKPWRRQLDPLGGLAVSIGLLGSVWSFTTAFGGFRGGIDVDRIVMGLGAAYTTTGFGLITAIIASLGSYCCELLARRP